MYSLVCSPRCHAQRRPQTKRLVLRATKQCAVTLLSDVLTGRAYKLASPPAASTGASQHRTMSRHNFADSGDKRKHNVLATSFPELQCRPFTPMNQPRWARDGVESRRRPGTQICNRWMSGRLAPGTSTPGPTAPGEEGPRCSSITAAAGDGTPGPPQWICG
jgi:hypothetical protein